MLNELGFLERNSVVESKVLNSSLCSLRNDRNRIAVRKAHMGKIHRLLYYKQCPVACQLFKLIICVCLRVIILNSLAWMAE